MRTLLTCLFLIGISARVDAQTVTNPTTLTFTASADHATVTSYTFQIVNGATVVDSGSLGKPTPDATNTISMPVSNIPGFGGVPKGVTLYIFIFAANTTGASTGVASNPFVVAAAVPAAVSNVRMQ